MMPSKGSGSKSTSSGTHARSAITGRYVTAATAVRHPRTTVVETGKKPGKKS
jgi:hypothetical protein